MAVRATYTQARRQLAALLDEVVNHREIVIIERGGTADELSSLVEPAHLLRSPAHRDRLLTALVRTDKQTAVMQTGNEWE